MCYTSLYHNSLDTGGVLAIPTVHGHCVLVNYITAWTPKVFLHIMSPLSVEYPSQIAFLENNFTDIASRCTNLQTVIIVSNGYICWILGTLTFLYRYQL